MKFYQEGDWVVWVILMYFLTFPALLMAALADYFWGVF